MAQAEVLRINSHDYTQYIEDKGVSWSRNDLDSEDTGRTLDGVMHRTKITTKRKITYKLMNMTRAVMAQLDTDLSSDTFSATYLDLHGTNTTGTFYCSSFTATISSAYTADGEWVDASFTMIEC